MNNSMGFKSELDGRLGRISAQDFIAPLQRREAHFVPVGEPVGHKIKKLFTLQQMLEIEGAELATKKGEEAQEAYEQNMDFCDIVGRILCHDVRQQYRLAGRAWVICRDGGEWLICKEESKTAELFNPVEIKRTEHRDRDFISSRSDNILPNIERFRYPDPAPRR